MFGPALSRGIFEQVLKSGVWSCPLSSSIGPREPSELLKQVPVPRYLNLDEGILPLINGTLKIVLVVPVFTENITVPWRNYLENPFKQMFRLYHKVMLYLNQSWKM